MSYESLKWRGHRRQGKNCSQKALTPAPKLPGALPTISEIASVDNLIRTYHQLKSSAGLRTGAGPGHLRRPRSP